jgi:hypothetical protein
VVVKEIFSGMMAPLNIHWQIGILWNDSKDGPKRKRFRYGLLLIRKRSKIGFLIGEISDNIGLSTKFCRFF